MPVKAKVTAYGPYLSDPALNPSSEAPVGAPVAARGTFTTDPARDQSSPQTYSFLFDDEILEQGADSSGRRNSRHLYRFQ